MERQLKFDHIEHKPAKGPLGLPRPNLLAIIHAKLTADNLIGGSSGYPGFVGYSPPNVGPKIVTIMATGGLPDDSQKGDYTFESLQVRVRSNDYLEALNKWWAVFNSLQNFTNLTDGLIMLIAMNTGPIFFLDESNFPNFTLNMRARQLRP